MLLLAQVVLRKLFEKLGATYIKLGQFIASSPTLFPEEYVLEFQKCLDRTEPVPWEVIKKTIDRELATGADDIFSEIHPVPLATASIAQVHSAGALSRPEPSCRQMASQRAAIAKPTLACPWRTKQALQARIVKPISCPWQEVKACQIMV